MSLQLSLTQQMFARLDIKYNTINNVKSFTAPCYSSKSSSKPVTKPTPHVHDTHAGRKLQIVLGLQNRFFYKHLHKYFDGK